MPKQNYEGGENPENAPLNPEENKAPEPAKPASVLSKQSSNLNSADRAKLAVANKEAFVCCCCICQCSVKETEDLTCCCIFPIKAGVNLIAALIIVITVFSFLEIFYQLLNDDIAWWYVAIALGLAIPLLIACFFGVLFFSKDTPDSRGNLTGGCILVITSVALIAGWNAIYFLFFYDKSNVKQGNDGVGWYTATVKQEVVISLYIAAITCSAFAYFICVVGNYKDALKKRDERLAQEKADKEKAMAGSK